MTATVYIAGPMTGYVNHNFDAFNRAAEHLRSKGYNVVNPAELDSGLSQEELRKTPHHVFMRRDIDILLGCDLIYLLPGWDHSTGATLEFAVANGCGIDRLMDSDVEIWRSFEGDPIIPTDCSPACEVNHTFAPGCELYVPGTQLPGHVPGFLHLPAIGGVTINSEAPCSTEPNNPRAALEPCTELTCPKHGPANRREAETEALDLMAGSLFGDIPLTVDASLPPDTVRIFTGHGDYFDLLLVDGRGTE